MRLKLVSAPTQEPVELDAVKSAPELRIDAALTDHDSRLKNMIRSASRRFEDFTGRILMRSTWDLYLDEFPGEGESIELPAPLASVTSVSYRDASGTLQTMSPSLYVVDTVSEPVARIALAYGQTWPSTCDEINAVLVRFTAGWTPKEVEQDVIDGILLYIQSQYDGIDRAEDWQRKWSHYRRWRL